MTITSSSHCFCLQKGFFLFPPGFPESHPGSFLAVSWEAGAGLLEVFIGWAPDLKDLSLWGLAGVPWENAPHESSKIAMTNLMWPYDTWGGKRSLIADNLLMSGKDKNSIATLSGHTNLHSLKLTRHSHHFINMHTRTTLHQNHSTRIRCNTDRLVTCQERSFLKVDTSTRRIKSAQYKPIC